MGLPARVGLLIAVCTGAPLACITGPVSCPQGQRNVNGNCLAECNSHLDCAQVEECSDGACLARTSWPDAGVAAASSSSSFSSSVAGTSARTSTSAFSAGVPSASAEGTSSTSHSGAGSGSASSAAPPSSSSAPPSSTSASSSSAACSSSSAPPSSSGCGGDRDCGDANPCTVDRCVGGACEHNGYSCDDSNPCTDRQCDGAGGCTTTSNTASCNDNDACTHTDRCSGGTCAGTAYACNDRNPCTRDSCDGSGGCAVSADNEGGRCADDGAICGQTISCHVCRSGSCEVNTPHYNGACLPSCGVLGGLCGWTASCQPDSSYCTGAWSSSNDCGACCHGDAF